MLRRRHINADPKGAARRLLLGAADAARWPFERVAWQLERRLVWPLRERTAGWDPPRNAAGVAALGAVAIAAVLVGVLLSGGGGRTEVERVAGPARAAIAPAPVKPADARQGEPTLQGVPPSFGVGKGVGVAKQSGAGSSSSAEGSAAPAVEAEAGGAGGEASAGAPGEADGEGAAATSSQAKPVPAGPEAMKVARRFSEAFVFYEIGERPARAKTVFGETATPQLAEALAERPPRLPADAKVPKAKVVNLVPGPRHGKAYTVSVSLLRVGLTSELRISLEHSKAGGWRVSEILG
jgi:hypothetical protein